MAANKDWLPKTRAGQLAMAQVWVNTCTAKATAWAIPKEPLMQLATLSVAAGNALAEAQNEATRTPVATAKCRAAFDALTACMRDIHRRYLIAPPLTDADIIGLGLKPRDTTPTPTGTPTAQITLETYLVGRHELGVRIVYVTGSKDDKANKGYRIWYNVLEPGEAAPTDPKQLNDSFYTKRQKDVIEFEFGDSGKTVWFATQVENDGKKGPWGELVSALIP